MNDPVPVTVTVSPSSALVGAPDTTVTVRGGGFVPASVVLAGTSPLATTYVSSKFLTAVIPAASLAAPGTIPLTVSNPAPGGGTSTPALPFSVSEPAPVATSVSPSFAAVGSPATAITVTGSSFVSSSTVLLGGSPLATTFTSATSLGAVIPAASLATAGTLAVAVSTPGPGGGTSAPLGFTVDNPGPSITTITPNATTVPGADTPITVSGSGFLSGVSVVRVGGSPLATTYSGGALGATLPASALAAAATLSITVTNPAPGGGTSNVAYFTASDPVPVLTAVAPASIYALSPATPITLTGSGFVPGSVVSVNGGPVQVTAVSATSITATIPAPSSPPPARSRSRSRTPRPAAGRRPP